MREIKISYLIILMILLFLSISLVSAADNDTNSTITASDTVFDSSISTVEATNDLQCDADDSQIDTNGSDDLGVNVTDDSKRATVSEEGSSSSKLSKSNEEMFYEEKTMGAVISNNLSVSNSLNVSNNLNVSNSLNVSNNLSVSNNLNVSNSSVIKSSINVSAGSVITITESTYSKYFNSSTGAIIGNTIKNGDTIQIANLTDKVFTISKSVNIISATNSKMTNCLIRLVKGSSSTNISGLTIINTKQKSSGFYLSGIHIINSWNNTIANNTINVTGKWCFAIALENASYNKISNNVLISGSSSTMPMTASSHNTISNNHVESESANLIYYCPYGAGDFVARHQTIGRCAYNYIINNTLTTRSGMNSSLVYAIDLESDAGTYGTVIANNTIYSVYEGVRDLVAKTTIANNTFYDIGEKAIYISANNVTVYGNNITVNGKSNSGNKNTNASGIDFTGNNVKITKNTITVVNANGIQFTKSNNTISNNTIYVSSADGIYYSNLVPGYGYNNITNNTIIGKNASAILLYASKTTTKDQIINNDISSDNDAIILQGSINRPTVVNNTINITGDGKGIVLLNYTNKQHLSPENYSIYDNIINGESNNVTNGSWVSPNTTDVQIIVESINITKGDNFVLYLKDENKTPVINATITLVFLDKEYNLTTDNFGKVSLQLNESPGEYSIDVIYGGLEDYYFAASEMVDITVNAGSVFVVNNTIIKRSNYFDVYLVDENGTALSNQVVSFKVHNTSYYKTTDENGKASLQINLLPGQYDFRLDYDGESGILATSRNLTITVVNKDVKLADNTYIVREDNYNTFFTSDGDLKPFFANSTLILAGSFTKKRFVLTYPANLIGAGAVLYDSVVKVTSDNVSVDGLKIINKHSVTNGSLSDLIENNLRYGILLDSVKNVSITNNKIGVKSYDNAYGIFISESFNNTIDNNKINSSGNHFSSGVFVYQSDNNAVNNNSIEVNGTSKVHQYESSIVIDYASSVDDFEAGGMTVPEVYKTYGIILFESSNNEFGYNDVSATSGLTKYYTAEDNSTNSIVGIDIYYSSHNNKVHNNNINVSAKDPYLYGAGVLGDETGQKGTTAENNSFTYNNIYVKGTFYAAGIIAGYSSLNTIMYKNNITLIATNVSYGVILEGSDKSSVSYNTIKSKAQVNYIVEGYESNGNVIHHNNLDSKGEFVANVVLHASSNNKIVNNSLSYYNAYVIDFSNVFRTEHTDVIDPINTDFYQQGKSKNNTFADNTVKGSSSWDSPTRSSGGGSGSGNGGSGNGGSGILNGNGTDGMGDGTGSSGSINGTASVQGTGYNSSSGENPENGVGTSSSAPASQADAYKLNADDEGAASASRSLGSMNMVFFFMILLIIFATAYELYKKSKRNLR